jgi:hypothetical protein
MFLETLFASSLNGQPSSATLTINLAPDNVAVNTALNSIFTPNGGIFLAVIAILEFVTQDPNTLIPTETSFAGELFPPTVFFINSAISISFVLLCTSPGQGFLQQVDNLLQINGSCQVVMNQGI